MVKVINFFIIKLFGKVLGYGYTKTIWALLSVLADNRNCAFAESELYYIVGRFEPRVNSASHAQRG